MLRFHHFAKFPIGKTWKKLAVSVFGREKIYHVENGERKNGVSRKKVFVCKNAHRQNFPVISLR